MMTVAAPAFVPQTSLLAPPALRSILRELRAAVPDAILVGGAVRDLIAGRTPFDIDILTRGDAAAAAEAIARRTGGHPFALDAERAQYRVTFDADAASPYAGIHDIDVSQIDSLDTDLARRDFTVNAMAAPILEDGALGEVIDPTGGLRDVDAWILRMVSVANLEDDSLRLLRAVRLATDLDFTIDPGTVAAISSLAPRLGDAAGERQRDELVRIFETPRAASGVRLADALGLLDVLIPELAPARGIDQPKNHHFYDVFEHSLQTLAALDEMLHDVDTTTGRPWLGPDFRENLGEAQLHAYFDETTGGSKRLALLKLAGLLHDVAKPETKALHEGGRIRFLGHAEQGAVKAGRVCGRLRFGNRETRFVTTLVEEHLRPTMLAQPGSPPTRRALYRFFRDLGEAAPACLVLSLADAAAATGPRLQRERWRGHVAYARHVLYEGQSMDNPAQGATRRLLTGNDLMRELGMEAGPALGRVLAALDEAQALGEVTTREDALTFAREAIAGRAEPPASIREAS